MKLLVVPAGSPKVNAHAERFVLHAESGALARIVPLGERHLRAVVRAFVEHGDGERPHQGLDDEIISPEEASAGTGRVRRRERLGGVLSFCYRRAA